MTDASIKGLKPRSLEIFHEVVTAYLEDGLPVGAQLMAPAYEDQRLFGIGAALEALIVQRDGSHVSSRVPEPGQPRVQVA